MKKLSLMFFTILGFFKIGIIFFVIGSILACSPEVEEPEVIGYKITIHKFGYDKYQCNQCRSFVDKLAKVCPYCHIKFSN